MQIENLKLRYNISRERCAELYERYNHRRYDAGPAIESRYVEEIGQYEFQTFRLEVSSARWRRRFELRQIAINLGETPDYVAIEKTLDAEYAEYEKSISEMASSMDRAQLYFSHGVMTDEDTTDIRVLYLTAVKRLNPDYLPFQSPVAHSGNTYSTRRIGVRMRLLHHRIFAEIFGQEKNVAALEGIGIDFNSTTPLWVSLRVGTWSAMMDELADLADDTGSFPDEQDRIQMLAFSALEGSNLGRERLFDLTGIEFDESVVDYHGRFPPSEKMFESFMRYRNLQRKTTV